MKYNFGDADYLGIATLTLSQKPSQDIYLELTKLLQLKYEKLICKEVDSEKALVILQNEITRVTLIYKKSKNGSEEPGISIMYISKDAMNGITPEDRKATEKL